MTNEVENKIIKLNNKQLVERYPFLIPRNVWTDKISDDYDYSYTLMYCVPKGWTLLFLMCCEELRNQLIKDNYLDKFRFSQVKEKYGTLRLYTFGHSAKVNKIIMKYEHLSKYVCQQCGKIGTYETPGWISYLCKDCVSKVKHLDKLHLPKTRMRYRCSKHGKTTSHTIRIDSTIKKYKQYQLWFNMISTLKNQEGRKYGC